MIYNRTPRSQLISSELLLLTSISIVIAGANEFVSGRLNHDLFVGSSSIVILPQNNYSKSETTSIQSINDTSSSDDYIDREGLISKSNEQDQQPVFDIAFADNPEEVKSLSLNINSLDQGYLLIPREMKNFRNSTTLYDLLNRVSNKADHDMSSSIQHGHKNVISANQWAHTATTTARPAYDQIPRPLLYSDDKDEDDHADVIDTESSYS